MHESLHVASYDQPLYIHFLCFMFHHKAEREHKRVWTFKALTYFTQVQRSHQPTLVGCIFCFFYSTLRLYASRSEHKYASTADKNEVFSMTLVRLIKELCLILYERFHPGRPRLSAGCTRRSSTRRANTRQIFISYATDNKFQRLSCNLQGKSIEKLSPAIKKRKLKLKKALEMKFCGSLSGWNCNFYLRIASHFADT